MMFTFFYKINTLLFYSINSLLYINILDFCIFIGLVFNFWYVISIPLFRKKFIFFIGFLFFLSSWGFYYSWDGWVCLLLLTELLVILLFLLVWLSFKFSESSENLLKKFKLIFFLISFFFYIAYITNNYSNFVYNYHVLYLFNHNILSSDFHVMFKFFFLDYSISVFYITLLLSLISIFFICFYLGLKKTQNTNKKKKKLIHILRKQQMTKQALFKSQLRTFQLK